jgi:UDP-N-acetylmuramate dehydrogenase
MGCEKDNGETGRQGDGVNQVPKSEIEALAQALGTRVTRHELLSRHTTVRIGGPADLYVEALTSEELANFVLLSRQHNVPCLVLGGGSNVLVSDAGIRGLVIANKAKNFEFKRLRLYSGPDTDSKIEAFVWAESGIPLPVLARECIERGYANLEWAIGIPGTLGGAVGGNAGAHGGSIARDLISATILEAEERNWTNEELGFGYRTSVLKETRKQGRVVLAASFRLQPEARETLEARAAEILERRKRNQPPGATLGSTFRNPPGDHAGRLIEAAGLKGTRIGDAHISPQHANFFVNLGASTAADMRALINLAQEKVKAQFGVKLELEVELIGAWGQI